VLDLARREDKSAMIVMTRGRAGTRLAEDVAQKAGEMDAEIAATTMANRVVYAETLGQGRAALEGPKGPAHAEVENLVREVQARLNEL
jgi:chromosome partitioning protein